MIKSVHSCVLSFGFMLSTVLSAAPITGKSVHGLAIDGPLKYGPDMAFEWPNKDAPKGGRLVLGVVGTYDSLNPFAVKNSSDGLMNPGMRLNMVFENLAFDSMGESFGKYGLLAESIEVAPDFMSMTFTLNAKAKFSDGKPVTADDVLFSFTTLTSDKAPPALKYYFADVKSAKILTPQKIKFDFKVKNRELPLILCELVVMPKHIYGATKDFVKGFVKTKPVASGPYVLKSFDFGKQITYEKNKSWWGYGQPAAKGAWNYDEIQVKYYKDSSAAMEAFKAGEYDVRFENSSRAWAVDHAGDRWNKGWIRKELWPNERPTGGQGFFMNLRRPIFKDRLVRKALAIAFDFDWTNETLFYKQYTQSSSYFNNSSQNAKGLPDAKELALLNPLRESLPPEVFTEPKDVLGKGLTGKQRLGEAMKIFKEAGWEVKGGKLTNKAGEVLSFTFLDNSEVMQRVIDPYIQALAKIGVVANVKLEDSANYRKRIEKHDFDVISVPIGQTDSPGNEQRDYWHSVSADKSESRNYSGLANPAVDSLVETLIKAETRDDLVTATRALDRALWFSYISIPHWYMAADRISFWDYIQTPKSRPYNYSDDHFVLTYGWFDAQRFTKVQNAMKTNSKL